MTTFEQRIQAALGAQLMSIAQLSTQLEEAQAKIAELEGQLKDATTKAPEKK